MQMIRYRNLSTHIYDEKTISDIVDAVTGGYLSAFLQLEATLLHQQASA